MRIQVTGAAFLIVACIQPVDSCGQELADYDYENLSLRGITFEAGHVYASNIEDADIVGVRLDLGFLGPGFRLLSGISYWTSTMARAQVDRFESRLDALNESQGGISPPGGFNLGIIDRSDVIVSLDGHYMWAIPLGLFFWAGAGLSAHFLDGSSPGFEDTFLEDLLSSVGAGLNFHGGLEYPISERIRMYGSSKFELLENLNYLELRAGLRLIWGGLVQGESR